MKKTKSESLKTRQYLLNAALEVFYRQGVTRSTLQEIAQEAGVTRGALYWHFKNKEDLFEALFQQLYNDILVRFEDKVVREAPDALMYLREILLDTLKIVSQDELHRKFCDVLNQKCERTPHNETVTALADKYHHLFLNQITHILKICREQKKLPENIDLELATLFLKSHFAGLIRLWIFNPEDFDLSVVAETMIDASIHALQNNVFLLKK